jgi:hypothetical protein
MIHKLTWVHFKKPKNVGYAGVDRDQEESTARINAASMSTGSIGGLRNEECP